MGWLGPRSGAATCRHPEGLRTEAQHSALQPQAMWTHSRVPADAAFETTVGNCQAPPLTCLEHKIMGFIHKPGWAGPCVLESVLGWRSGRSLGG